MTAMRAGHQGSGEGIGELPRRLVGERVVLRGPVPADADDRLAAGFDPEVVLLQGGEPSQFREPMTREWADRWYERMVADDNPWGWMVEFEGRHVGSARLCDHVPVDRKANYAVALNSSALLGRGLGTEVTRLVLDFAFGPEPNGAGLHRVELRVLDFNRRGIACYRRCGFVEEGRERQAAFVDGVWRDYVVMGVLEDDPRS
jgi:RimJ/RimL family protein N-acetyltransferase